MLSLHGSEVFFLGYRCKLSVLNLLSISMLQYNYCTAVRYVVSGLQCGRFTGERRVVGPCTREESHRF